MQTRQTTTHPTALDADVRAALRTDGGAVGRPDLASGSDVLEIFQAHEGVRNLPTDTAALIGQGAMRRPNMMEIPRDFRDIQSLPAECVARLLQTTYASSPRWVD